MAKASEIHTTGPGIPPVLVLGGTGHLGRNVVERLLARGMRVRVLSRTPGNDERLQWVPGDLATGAGLNDAFSGVSHVIHAATNSPIARRGSVRLADLWHSPSVVDLDGTKLALEIAERTWVDHFLYVSIVGLEDSRLPYSRVKLAGEWQVRASAVPWSMVRATPFFYLVERMLDGLSRRPNWLLPNSAFQPVDTRDVAEHIVANLVGPARGELPAIRGPEITSYAAMARAHLIARGMSRSIVTFSLPDRWARQAGMVVADGAQETRSWERWLADQTAGIA